MLSQTLILQHVHEGGLAGVIQALRRAMSPRYARERTRTGDGRRQREVSSLKGERKR